MADVLIPQRRDRNADLFQLGGAVAGGILGSAGGPAGTVGGAMMGSQLGGMANQQLNPQASKQPMGVPKSGQSEALMRRQQQLAQDNLASLKLAENTLPSLPEDLRQQYAPAIMKARMMEEQRRGMV